MDEGRRQFIDEFKRQAVGPLANSGRLLTPIAVPLGIQPSMLRNWRDRREGRNAGPVLRPSTSASAPRSVSGPGGRDLPASPPERSAKHGARHSKKNCGRLLGAPK